MKFYLEEEWFSILDEETTELKNEVYAAFLTYVLTGVEPDFKGVALMAFKALKVMKKMDDGKPRKGNPNFKKEERRPQEKPVATQEDIPFPQTEEEDVIIPEEVTPEPSPAQVQTPPQSGKWTQALKDSPIWIESVKKEIYRTKYVMPTDQEIYKLIDDFETSQSAYEQTDLSLAEAKKHFVNWLRKQRDGTSKSDIERAKRFAGYADLFQQTLNAPEPKCDDPFWDDAPD